MKKSTVCRLIAAVLAVTMLGTFCVGATTWEDNWALFLALIRSHMAEKQSQQTLDQMKEGELITMNNAGDLPEALSSVSVRPTAAKDGVVSRSTSFAVVTASATDAATVAKYVAIYPHVECEVTGSGTEFVLKPREVLEANTLYRVKIEDPDAPKATLLSPAAFVFQTEDTPRVTDVFPADYAEGVPVNTGIEFTFSGRLDTSADFAKFVTVEPAVEFRTEVYQHGKTLVVIPEEELDEGVIYTFTLAAGIPLEGGLKTAEAARTSFRTVYETPAGEMNFAVRFNSREYVFRTDEEIGVKYTLNLYDYNNVHAGKEPLTLEHGKTSATVYRYDSAADAAAALLDYERNAGDYALRADYRFDVSALERVLSTDVDPVISDERASVYSASKNCTAVLPALPEGCYLVDFSVSAKAGEQTFEGGTQVFIQVTDIAVNTVSAGGTVVLWLQKNGEALSGALVDAHVYSRRTGWNLRPLAQAADGAPADAVTEVSAKADEDGLAYVAAGEDNSVLAVIRAGGSERYATIRAFAAPAEMHRVYVYTDRETYNQNDTVNFWGVITPNDVRKLNFTSNVAKGGSVTVSADGTFKGSFSYADYAGYGVSISFTNEEGNGIGSAYKRVTHDEKPVYTASLTFDKPFYLRNDTITATISAAFYDGTPAANLTFSYYATHFGKGEVTTGPDGTADIVLKNSTYVPMSTDPLQASISVELIGEEASTLNQWGNFWYFPSDCVYTVTRGSDDIVLTLNALDTSWITEPFPYITGEMRDKLKGAPADGRVSVSLIRRWTEIVETGSYYDPITKTTQKTTSARTQTEETPLPDYVFENGEIHIPYYETDDISSSYTYRITFNDPTNGATIQNNVGAKKPVTYYGTASETEWPELDVIRDDESKNDYAPYVPGERASFCVRYLDGVKSLFVLANADGILDVLVSGENTYTATFEGKAIPTARLFVLCADTKTSAASNSFEYDFMYDYETLNLLNVTILPEKEKALPGEKVNVTLSVTDPDGKPVRNAEILLSVVDEACFALGRQTLDPATPLGQIMAFRLPNGAVNSVYRIFDNLVLYGGKAENATLTMMAKASFDGAAPMTTTAARAMTGGAGVEAAMNDPSYVREIFADNPYFVTARTDKDGVAVVSCTMPDNITTWRLSAIASARETENASPVDVLLGAAKDAIVVTQPFFLTSTVGSVFIEGDDIALGAKVSGVGSFDAVKVTASLFDAAGTRIAQHVSEGEKDRYLAFNLGKVPAGTYSVLLSASAGQYADTVRSTFTVVDSAILLRVNKTVAPEKTAALKPSLYPVTLSFYDGSNTLVSAAVNEIMCRRNSRTDAKAAYAAALLVCQNLWGASSLYESEIANVLNELNRSDGGWGIYDYANADPALTAKILLLLGEQLSFTRKESAANYLAGIVTSADDAATVTAALMGLAAADRPVLGDLRYVRDHFAEMKNADDRAKLILSAAFAVAGDAESASSLYGEVAARLRTVKNNETYFALAKGTAEDTLALKYAALLSASLTNAEDAAELERYLVRRDSAYELYSLEHAIFAAAYAPTKYEPKVLKYTLNGEEKTVEIGRRVHSVTMRRDEYETFAVLSADDGILARAMYWGTPAEADCLTSPDLSLTKFIEPVKGKDGFYRVTIRVSGTVDTDSFYASLTDLLPTGSRFVRLERSDFSSDTSKVYGSLWESDGEMHGTVWVGNYQRPTTAGRASKTFEGEFSYVIRAYAAGEFVAESAYLVDPATNTAAISERSTVAFH